MPEKAKAPKPLGQVLKEAGKKALGGGIAGALAMVIQVVALMWSECTRRTRHLSCHTAPRPRP